MRVGFGICQGRRLCRLRDGNGGAAFDPQFRMAQILRTRLRLALKRTPTQKRVTQHLSTAGKWVDQEGAATVVTEADGCGVPAGKTGRH